jgi:hypothetical protein
MRATGITRPRLVPVIRDEWGREKRHRDQAVRTVRETSCDVERDEQRRAECQHRNEAHGQVGGAEQLVYGASDQEVQKRCPFGNLGQSFPDGSDRRQMANERCENFIEPEQAMRGDVGRRSREKHGQSEGNHAGSGRH